MKPVLDDGWIRAGVMKRKANYSPILCFETVDPKRIYQLKEFVLSSHEFPNIEHIFLYDPWDGLGTLKKSQDSLVFESYKKKVQRETPLSSRLRQDEGVVMQALKAILKEMDTFLKTTPTVFIIQNLAEVREQDTGFQSALRAWAMDPSVVSKGSTVIILTSDASRLMDDFTREFVVTIEVDPSSTYERRSLIETIGQELGVHVSDNKLETAQVTLSGLNLHQVESILLESYHRKHDFDPFIMKELKSEMVKRTKVLEVRDPQFCFRDIGGYHAIKDFVSKYIINVLKRPDKAKKFGLGLPKGLLFFGPPGTGKSLFANALASEVQLPFINLVTENIYSKWLGESGQNMKNAITMAEKMSPAIVFVDEIDRFGKRTGSSAGSAEEETQRVFSQFLEWLGRPDREAIIVGTTNVPEYLDDAFLRAGRFDYKIPFLYPGPDAQLEILLVHLGYVNGSKRDKVPMDIPDDKVKDFLKETVLPFTTHFSCAELEELVIRAKRVAFDRDRDAIGEEDLLQAAKSFRIDVSQRKRTIRSCMQQARRFTDDQSFLDAIEEENKVYDNDEATGVTEV